jgi:cysteine synthase A
MYGAKLILTPAEKGMSGAIEKAEFLASETSNSFIPYQFKNPANPAIHYTTTGPEIYNSMQSEVDVLVAGVGTGGTISGVGKFMKEKNPNTFVVALEPYDSPVLSGGKPGPHKIQGIGAGFIPDILNLSIIDEVITIKYEDAFETAKMLASYGIFCGISSGANVYGALQVAKRPKFKDKKIVTFICDTGERYLSNFISN